MRRLVASSAGVLGIRLLGAGLQLLSVSIVLTLFGFDGLGLYGIFWATAAMFRVGGAFGLDVAGMKEQAVCWHNEDYSKARGYGRRDTVALRRIWCGILAVMAVGGAVAYAGWGLDPMLLLTFTLAAASSSFQKLWTNQSRAAGQTLSVQALESIGTPLLSTLAAAMAHFCCPRALLSFQVLVVLAITWLLYLLNPLNRGYAESRALNPIAWKETLRLGASAGITALSARLGIFFVGIHSTSAMGIFELAQRIQSAATMTVSSIAVVFLPALRVELVSGTRRGLRNLIFRGSILASLLPFVLLLAHVTFGKQFIYWVMDEPPSSLWLTTLFLLIASLFNGISGLSSSLISMGGFGNRLLTITLVQLLVFVVGVFSGRDFSAVVVAAWVLIAESVRSICLLIAAFTMLRGKDRTS